ncbi:MAG: methylated DNA-protein cysteine methyltransferase [Cytophagales bacterium]|nr:methylated DNA-protein cysteine methyltransferase [Cytophagales bacterium]
MKNTKSSRPWRGKFEKIIHYEIKPADNKTSTVGQGSMLIATPALIAEIVNKVPEGKLITIPEIRRRLAAKMGADFTCPLTTGIFLRIAAETAEEDKNHGEKYIIPYWRVVREDGTLIDKFPNYPSLQSEYLSKEHLYIVPKGKSKLIVKDYEKFLI